MPLLRTSSRNQRYHYAFRPATTQSVFYLSTSPRKFEWTTELVEVCKAEARPHKPEKRCRFHTWSPFFPGTTPNRRPDHSRRVCMAPISPDRGERMRFRNRSACAPRATAAAVVLRLGGDEDQPASHSLGNVPADFVVTGLAAPKTH
eukprot:GHVT01098195.1.p1 GENE.GHVT01098195.1~~GHVT01098195.1.p1  ORF type:complete len:147 (+),score=12.26 GHVT01098195.1:664-1104(+)